jgi:hypothetical protein
MHNQGIAYTIPCWIFTIAVLLPFFAGVFAEILIYLKQRKDCD